MAINVHDKYRVSTPTVWDKLYFPAIIKGMLLTLKHFFDPRKVTVQYPEKKMPVAPRFRGRHCLKRDENGKARCVACFACQYACPAGAITITAAEISDSTKNDYVNDEKYPLRYEIDLLRCVYCGFCQEACPKGAIYLEQNYEIASDDKSEFYLKKEDLLEPKGGPIKFVP
ncbi:MAG: NADH-quinone oxidoreductase subunit NuoI [Spirochaetes bacterium]|nr:NADH-quinone oxidoreductase subunit NuoI [Spirochaetota bacterium]